jgi:hypothetical protein
MRAVTALATGIATLIAVHGAQAQGGDTLLYKRPDEIRVRVQRASVRPVLDGRLDDAAWRDAVPLDRFMQYDPVDGVLPPQPSVGHVTYDDEFLYVAFRAYEADAENIRATMHPRERGGELDDKVAVALDTYNDNRRAYVFRVSPAGLQFDGVKTEGQPTDDTPDLVWYSAARIDEEGWVAELAIPFASLRLPPRPSLEFGFDIVRYHGKAGVRSSWSPRRLGSPCDICRQGTLLGITGISARRTFDVLPYVSGSEVGARSFRRDSALIDGQYHPVSTPHRFDLARPSAAVGGDLRVVLTPSATFNATVNPDFSQVESDDEQVTVNQRFALFYQERRPFFLESRDVFDVSRQGSSDHSAGVTGQLFYTRAIVNPSAGARLSGKAGATQYGLLYARDEDPAWFSYDRHESSGLVPSIGTAAHAVVARIRRDVLADSWVGLSFLARDAGTARTAVTGADVALRRGRIVWSAEGTLTSERAPNAESLSAALDGRTRHGASYASQLSQSGRTFTWSLTTAGFSPGFRNQLGRYTRVGVESFTANAALHQYPNGAVVRRVTQSITASRTNRYGGGLLDYAVSPSLSLSFTRRANLYLSYQLERQNLLGAVLVQRGVTTDFSVESSRHVQFGGFVFGGDRELYDPADPRVSKGVYASLRVTLRPVPQASVELRGQRSNHYESWGGDLIDDAKILRLRGTYQVTRRLGARLIGEYSDQYNRLEGNPLYQRAVRYASSLLVTYELAPASFLYAGYNDLMQAFDRPLVVRDQVLRTGNQLFLKLSYLFRL